MAECVVGPECRPIVSRNLCSKHYQRWRLRGRPWPLNAEAMATLRIAHMPNGRPRKANAPPSREEWLHVENVVRIVELTYGPVGVDAEGWKLTLNGNRARSVKLPVAPPGSRAWSEGEHVGEGPAPEVEPEPDTTPLDMAAVEAAANAELLRQRMDVDANSVDWTLVKEAAKAEVRRQRRELQSAST